MQLLLVGKSKKKKKTDRWHAPNEQNKQNKKKTPISKRHLY